MRATLSYDEATNKLTITGASANEMSIISYALRRSAPDVNLGAGQTNILRRLDSVVRSAEHARRVAEA